MGNVFELNRQKNFDIQSAKDLLPLVYRITEDIDREFQEKVSRMTVAKQNQKTELAELIEAETKELVSRWESKITKLGLHPKGIWLVDFDTGKGFYCWKYPELELKFWHGYEDGFSGRRPILDNP